MAGIAVVSWMLLTGCPLAACVTVSTQYGPVRGATALYPSPSGPVNSVDRFLGIPFASAPVGERRFKPPEPPAPWTPDVHDATAHKSPCMQGEADVPYIKLSNPTFAGFSEDCLYLDIYSPAARPARRLPVMVYIHGGSYAVGAASLFDGGVLALHGVVVVVIQYRLNIFGFMTSGDGHAPGNYGMLDQVQALKFVCRNIGSFGGDPSQVTIFGESAGATSLSLLMLSPLSRGLFHRAIAESGVDLSPFAIDPKTEVVKATRDVAKEIGCNEATNQDMVTCMTNRATASQLLAAALSVSKGARCIRFAPVVDGRFLPDTPGSLRRAGALAPVDLVVSFNRDDGSFLLQYALGPSGVDLSLGVSSFMFTEFIDMLASTQSSDERTARVIADAVRRQYAVPWSHNDPTSRRDQLIRLVTDFLFAAPSHAVAEFQSDVASVYMGEFARRPHGIRAPAWMGVAHAFNAPYSFGVPLLHLPASDIMPAYNNADRNVSRQIMRFYTNFARTGNPSNRAGVTWDRFQASHKAYLKIDKPCQMAADYHPRRMAFWNVHLPELIGH